MTGRAMRAERTAPPPPMRRGWVLAALMFTIMLAAMDATIVATAIPHIVEELGGFALFSWVFSIYLLAQTVTIPVYGKLADIHGRKPILLIGTVVFLVGSVACAVAWDMVSLILFRGLQGLGAGAIMATVNTLAGDLYTIRERARVQGWLSSVWGMAAIVGPTLGGALAEYAHWRWIFLINIPVGMVSMALLAIFLKERFEKRVHHIDYPGAALMLVTGGLLIFTLMDGGRSWAWLSWQGVGMVSLTLAMVIITIRVEKRSPEPMMPSWVWRRKVLLGSNLAVVGMGIVMIAPNMFLPVYGQSVLGLGAIAAGLVLASMSVGWPVASSLSGILYLRIGFRDTALIGALVILAASTLFVLLPYQPPVWMVVADMVLLGAGFGLLSTPTMVGIQSVVPWEQRGVVTGTNMFGRYLGQSIGAAIMGGVFNGVMRDHLQQAPAAVSGQLPAKVDDVVDVLHSGELTTAAESYLQHAFTASTSTVFLAMAVAGLLSVASLMILPRRFPTLDDRPG